MPRAAPSSFRSAVADQIRSARVQKGLSQMDLAGLINIHPVNMNRLEMGKSSISLDQVQVIADALQLAPVDLITGVSL